VQAFINLIQRHEQSFYNFVHKVHSKGEGLFDSLMRWIELFLTIIREGLGQPLSLEFLLPHTGKDREDIMMEVDKVALYHYKLKVMYEDKLRRRFGKVQQNRRSDDADAEDEATQALVDGVVGEIDFGELVQGDAADLAAEETDESDDSDEEDSSEEESDSDESSSDDSSDESDDDAVRRKPDRTTPTVSPRTPTQARTDNEFTTPRQRSTSLRTSRSMASLKNRLSQVSLSRRSHDLPPAPPVPPLPLKNPYMAALSKPLPPSPSPSSSAEHVVPSASSRPSSRPNPPQIPKTKKRRKAPVALKPPDLVHIPQLLPVFTEMMRPSLRPRQRTNLPLN